MTTPNDFLQLVGTDTPNAPGAAYLCCTFNPIATPGNPDAYRVHFNVPEGTQRFCGEAARVRMPRTDLVLLTRLAHSTLMGLPGYVLTAQDAVLTGNRKAVTGKGAMAALKISEGEGGQPRGREVPRGDEGAEGAQVAGEAHGTTNKQRKEVEKGQRTFNRDTTGITGRVILVGGPRDAISCDDASSSVAVAASPSPAERWWRAMVSMYFHYRVQGVVDLAFVKRCKEVEAASPSSPSSLSPILFVLPLNGDRINGVAAADYYSDGVLDQRGLVAGGGHHHHGHTSEAVGKCCDVHVAGGKRARSQEARPSAAATPSATATATSEGAVDIRSMAPVEALSRLVAGGASQLIAFDTTGCAPSAADVSVSSSSAPPTTAPAVASYWCRFPPPAPKFDHRVAKEVFGVAPGPKYAALKQGKAVESDTLRDPATGGPLMVTLAAISAASLAAAAKAGGGAASAAEWSNVLVLDGDDEAAILEGLGAALALAAPALVIGGGGATLSRPFGRLSLVVVLCPYSAAITADFNAKVAAVFDNYNNTTQSDQSAAHGRAEPSPSVAAPLPRCVSSRAGLLSLEEIMAGVKVLSHEETAGASEASSSSSPLLSGPSPLPPSAFPTALAHRYHLNALAGDYFPIAAGGLTTHHTVPSEQQQDAPHPLTLTATDRVWWPFSILYRAIDGSLVNPPRVAELNDGLAEELRAVKGQALEDVVAPVSAVDETDNAALPIASESSAGATAADPSATTAQAAHAAAGKKGASVKGGAASAPSSAALAAASAAATGGDQDPPLRYPSHASSVDMLSAAFKAMVLAYGADNALKGVGVGAEEEMKAEAVGNADADTEAHSAAAAGAAADHMLFLGTGSAVPSKYRNVSGLVAGCEPIHPVQSPPLHPLLRTVRIVCDFGEGSTGQWAQFLGPASDYAGARGGPAALLSPLELSLLTTRAVFISHNHADHVLGIFGLVDNYAKACRRARRVVAAWRSRSLKNATAEAAEVTAEAEAALILSLAAKPMLIICPRNFRDFLTKTVPLLCGKEREEKTADALPSTSSINSTSAEAESSLEAAVAESAGWSPSCVSAAAAGVRHLLNGNIFTIDLEPLTVTDADAAAQLPPQQSLALNGATRTVAAPRLFFEAFVRQHYGPAAAATVIPVDHPAQAHALFFRTAPQWSWCYSGDTRPWPLLNAVAMAPTYAPLRVLVHECTFDDDLAAEAVFKKHSTLSEALGAGVACGAEHVLLNHFSQRYPKIPPAAAAAASRLRKAGATKSGAESVEGGNDATEANDNAEVLVAAATDREEGSAKPPLPAIPFTFSFDGMLVPYASGLHSGDLVTRLPLFQWLLDEYDNWTVGTSQRLRGRREAAANAAIAFNKDHQASKAEERERRRAEQLQEKLEKQRAGLERHKKKEMPKKSAVEAAAPAQPAEQQ